MKEKTKDKLRKLDTDELRKELNKEIKIKNKAKNILGQNLKAERLKKDLRQDEVAKKINKSRETYSRYENGTLTPDAETLCMLADIYGVTVEELTGKDLSTMMNVAFRMGYKIGLDALDMLISGLNEIKKERTEQGKENQNETTEIKRKRATNKKIKDRQDKES